MNKSPEDSKLSYILSIFIMVAGFFLYIVSDIFSKAKSTLSPQIQYLILIDLIIFPALFIILISFSVYLFLEGLRFIDNDQLKSLSKYSNEFYTSGFVSSLIFIPLAIYFILFNRFNNLFINILSVVVVLIYFYKFVLPLRIFYHKISYLLILVVSYVVILILPEFRCI